MINLLVYPYSAKESCLIEYSSMLKEYKIKSIVYLEGMLEEDNIIQLGDNQIHATSDFESEVKSCDAVLILDTYFDSLQETYIKNIQLALSYNKKILLDDYVYDALPEDCKRNNSNFVIDINAVCLERNIPERRIFQPSIPVITVSSFGESCRKFEAQLDIRNGFTDKGYKVLQFGTKDYSSLFGFEKLPSFLFSRDIAFANKVDMFQYYIQKKSLEDDFDVIILGIPGSIIPYNDFDTCYYGELALVISTALKIDINVLCIYHNDALTVDRLQYWKETLRYKMNCETDYFYMSDTQCRILEDERVSFLMYDKEYCINSIPAISSDTIHFCHRLRNEEKHNFIQDIIEELEDNIQIV